MGISLVLSFIGIVIYLFSLNAKMFFIAVTGGPMALYALTLICIWISEVGEFLCAEYESFKDKP